MFRDLLESAPDAMVIVDETGRIVLVNSQTVALFGWQREELLGEPVETLIPHRFRGQHPGHRAGFFAQPKVRQMGAGLDLFGLRKNNTEFPVEISLSPIQTEDGLLVASAIRDASERKRAEQLLQEANRLKSEFLANMSHELRTPLNGILGFSELLVDQRAGALNDKQREYLTDIHECGKHLLQLINDVLDLSKVEAGRMELWPETFSPSTAVSAVCALVGPIARKKRIRLTPAADMWSLGMIVVEACSQRTPVWNRDVAGDLGVPDWLPEPFQEIARECIRWDPAARISIARAKELLERTVTPITETIAPVPREAEVHRVPAAEVIAPISETPVSTLSDRVAAVRAAEPDELRPAARPLFETATDELSPRSTRLFGDIGDEEKHESRTGTVLFALVVLLVIAAVVGIRYKDRLLPLIGKQGGPAATQHTAQQTPTIEAPQSPTGAAKTGQAPTTTPQSAAPENQPPDSATASQDQSPAPGTTTSSFTGAPSRAKAVSSPTGSPCSTTSASRSRASTAPSAGPPNGRWSTPQSRSASRTCAASPACARRRSTAS